MKNIKKYLGILGLSLVLVSCSNATMLSSGRTFHEANLGKSKVADRLQGRFDYEKDIAIVSKASRSEISARTNAEWRLHKEIVNYSYEILSQLMKDSNVQGPGFNNYQMERFAIEIADRYTRTATEMGKFNDEKGNYYVALKISKEEIKKQSIRIFVERVNRVIERLKELKEGI